MRRQGSYLDVAPGTPQSSRVIDGYRIEKELLGVGTWAEVRRAIHATTGKRVAVKMILKSRLSPSDRKLMSREIQIMQELDHPNLCKLLHATETDEHILIFMELFETDLFNLSQSQPKVMDISLAIQI
jgi:carbon catabolite-derepressing protein kinase